MKREKIETAIADAYLFIARANAALIEVEICGSWVVGTAKSGALRRQSLELTRALSEMRKSP